MPWMGAFPVSQYGMFEVARKGRLRGIFPARLHVFCGFLFTSLHIPEPCVWKQKMVKKRAASMKLINREKQAIRSVPTPTNGSIIEQWSDDGGFDARSSHGQQLAKKKFQSVSLLQYCFLIFWSEFPIEPIATCFVNPSQLSWNFSEKILSLPYIHRRS